MQFLLRESLKTGGKPEKQRPPDRRNRRFIVKPRLQFRIAFIVLLSMTMVLLVSFAGFYFFAVEELMKFNHPRIPLILERVNYALLASFVISAGAVTLAVIYLTHKIAGPLYRFEKSMEAVGRGDLTHVVKTRKGDELKDLEISFNDMIKNLRRKVEAGEKLLTAPYVETEVLPPGHETGWITDGKAEVTDGKEK
jgi:methyl-accepting chemotaxis protein